MSNTVYVLRCSATLMPIGIFGERQVAIEACQGWFTGAFVDQFQLGQLRDPGSFNNIYERYCDK
jgi:hypothetical protein